MDRPLQKIRKTLLEELKGARRIVALAVGSSLRGDDAAGLLAGKYLEKKVSPADQKRVMVLFGETAPENLSGQIRQFAPSHVLAMDAIDCGPGPGSVSIQAIDQVSYNASCSTHGLPLSLLAEYLARELGCKVIFLSIQAGSREVAAPPSKIVRDSARKVATMLSSLLPEILGAEHID